MHRTLRDLQFGGSVAGPLGVAAKLSRESSVSLDSVHLNFGIEDRCRLGSDVSAPQYFILQIKVVHLQLKCAHPRVLRFMRGIDACMLMLNLILCATARGSDESINY